MAMGWGSDLMQNETLFLILDGAMILIAVIIICAFHPAHWFRRLGRAKYMTGPTPALLAGTHTRKKRNQRDEHEMQQLQSAHSV